MHVELDNNRLDDHFPLVIDLLSYFRHPDWSKLPSPINSYNPYYFKNCNSTALVVTVGDSWTWGQDLCGYNELLDIQTCDWQVVNGILSNINSIRFEKSYGNLLSQHFNSDWLNLAVPGWGNYQMAGLVKNLADIIPYLHYDKILVVVTLTEVGRWFNTHVDVNIDHQKLFHKLHHPTQLLERLNSIVVDDITACLNKFSHVKLLVGTNFVDHIGLDNLLPEQRLFKPWYQLLDIKFDTPVYTLNQLAWSNFLRGIGDDIIPSKLHSMFKPWIMEISDKSNTLIERLKASPYITTTYHPLPISHKIWAEYIVKYLRC